MTNLFSPIPRFYIRDTTITKCAACSTEQRTVTFQGSFPQFDDHGRAKTNAWQTRVLNGNDPLYVGIEIREHFANNSTPICPNCEDSYVRPIAPVVDYTKVLWAHDPIKAKKINDAAEARLAAAARGGGKTIVRPAKPAAEKASKPPADILSMLAAMTKK